jgi:multiple antibiotic resistance protein
MFGRAEIFTILFVMLGPFKLLGPFVHRTRGLDNRAIRRIAFWTFFIATSGILAGSLIGRSVLQNWGVSIPALRISGGIIFFLVALRQVLELYEPAALSTPDPLPALPFAAATRLVFPMVLTPYGIAAVISLLAGSSDTTWTATILGLVLVVMVFNLFAMLLARRILVGSVVVVLQVVGAVLAILQVALAVQIILEGFRTLGVLPPGPGPS